MEDRDQHIPWSWRCRYLWGIQPKFWSSLEKLCYLLSHLSSPYCFFLKLCLYCRWDSTLITKTSWRLNVILIYFYILIMRICMPWLIIIFCIVICQYIWSSELMDWYLVLEIIFNPKPPSPRRNTRWHKGWKHCTRSLKHKVVSFFQCCCFCWSFHCARISKIP